MPNFLALCSRHVRRATRRLAEEHGISLLLALISLAVLSTVGGGVAVYTSSNLRASYTDKSSASAYHLAQAGLAEALSRLEGADDPTITTILPSTLRNDTSLGGTYTYSGTAITAAQEIDWTLTSTGTTGNPTKKVTLTQTAVVRGLVPGADLGSWSRFYQDDPNVCLTVDTVSMPTPLATKSDLCLVNGGSITGASTTIDVGKAIFISGPPLTGTTKYPTTATGWTNPTNVYTNNGVYTTNAIAAVSTGANEDSTNFALGLPATAQILGIKVQLEKQAPACCNTNEVQTISETGSPTAGTFTLTGTPPSGTSHTSVSIARNATAATVTSALAVSTMYGVGNVACTGGPLPALVTCTFQGAYASMPVSTMTFTRTGFVPSAATPVIGNPTNGAAAVLQDATVQLLKAGSPVGSNKASGSTWSTNSTTVTYGSSADLWGTTWTAADLNATNFGLRFAAKNPGAASATASLDWVSIQVTYNDDTNGIGTAAVPIADAQVGTGCTYNGAGPHNPCTATDHVNAANVLMSTDNPDLVMPVLDLNYWYNNAMPGPKNKCDDNNASISPLEFDTPADTSNNAMVTSNDNAVFDNDPAYDMTPTGRSYDCQVTKNGVLVGRLAWNYQTHVLTVGGTIFFDGDVRFDDDGQLIHYQGRALIYAAGDVEFDELVCAGGQGWPGDGKTPAGNSCVGNMANWDPTKNYLTLMANHNSEYDQGGTGCTGLTEGKTCNGIHPQSGFQGVVSAQGDCLIHERFFLSGPVVCGTISMPYASDGWPSYFSFPSLSSLVDGQKYGDLSTANAFEIQPGPQSG
jgi:hypothetical protein